MEWISQDNIYLYICLKVMCVTFSILTDIQQKYITMYLKVYYMNCYVFITLELVISIYSTPQVSLHWILQ